MKLWYKIKSIIAYYLRAKTRFDIHSPYVAHLIKAAIEHKPPTGKFVEIESVRTKMLASKQVVEAMEVGAGSRVNRSPSRTVGDIARSSLSSKRDCGLYYNLVRLLQPRRMLELGTCLGISTAYFQRGSADLDIISIEGNSSLSNIAVENLKEIFGEIKPQVIRGLFKETLPSVLSDTREIDLVFIDGDHSYQALIYVVESIRPYLSRQGLIIIHDIHWSPEMNKAWNEIVSEESIKLALDLYTMGLISYHPDLRNRVEASLINYWLKPWRVGLFAR